MGRRKDLRHEHRAPETVFSVWALAQSHFRADCLPQLHLAWEAQTQASLELPQQVLGTVMVKDVGGIGGVYVDDRLKWCWKVCLRF